MARTRIYLDYNATAPLLPAAREAVMAALDRCGNPSSVHSEGRAARGLIEEARAKVAALLGAEPKNLTFTSGGTEALNLALTPQWRDGGPPLTELLVGAGEHPCVLEGHRFAADRVGVVPLTPGGVVDLAALERMLDGVQGRALVAVQAANNETGVIQPVAEAAQLVHSHGGLLVCDAVQAAGRLDCSLERLGADAVAISAHKLGGPKGVGALALAHARLHIEGVLIRGGGQERGTRSGTENVPGIAGFSAAVQALGTAWAEEQERLRSIRDRVEEAILSATPDTVIFGRTQARLANTSAFAVPGLTAETLLIALDLAGFALSSGSACSSGKVKPSHVLGAMGVSADLAKGALRFSIGWGTRDEDAEHFCETFQKTVRNMRMRRAVPAGE